MVFITPFPRVAVSMAFLRPSRPRVAMRNLRRFAPWMDGTRSVISPLRWAKSSTTAPVYTSGTCRWSETLYVTLLDQPGNEIVAWDVWMTCDAGCMLCGDSKRRENRDSLGGSSLSFVAQYIRVVVVLVW